MLPFADVHVELVEVLIELVDVYRSACASYKGDQFCVPRGLTVKSLLEDFHQTLDQHVVLFGCSRFCSASVGNLMCA